MSPELGPVRPFRHAEAKRTTDLRETFFFDTASNPTHSTLACEKRGWIYVSAVSHGGDVFREMNLDT